MSEDNVYQDAEIVWVKLRSCWWPGEVCSHQRQPEGLLKHTKRKPYCVVKFFQEESFEYVKNAKMIYPFNCSKKDEFIRKGHALLAKNKYMEQFPAAVSTAERLTRSVTRSSLFFNSRPDSIIKAILTDSPPQSESIRNGRQCEIVDKILQTKQIPTTNSNQCPESPPTYKCSLCDFQSTRQNVMVLHRRCHSGPGTTPHKNSFGSRSIISSSNAKDLQKSRENFKNSNKAPKDRSNESAVRKEKEITHLTKNSCSIETPSEFRNTANKHDLASGLSSPKEKKDFSTVFIRPPPKKQLNFITCKSENIQKSLLADWIDEVKEDEEENQEETQSVETISPVNKNIEYSQISLPSTSASAQKFKNQEFVNQKSFATLIEQQKPISKIRNIPKKDRRNIVFTDFVESEETPCAESQSQKPTNVVSLQEDYIEEIDSSKPKTSTEEVSILGSVNVELLFDEALQINKSVEDILTSKIQTRVSKSKAKIVDESNDLPKTDCGRKMSELTPEKGNFPKDSIEDAVSTKDLSPEECIVKNLTDCRVLTESGIEKLNRNNLNRYLLSAVKKTEVRESSSVQLITEKSGKQESFTEKASEVNCNLEEQTIVNLTLVKSNTEEQKIKESSAEDGIRLALNAEEQASLESFSKKTAKKPSLSELSSIELSETNAATMKISSTETVTTEISKIEPLIEKSSTEDTIISKQYLLDSSSEELCLEKQSTKKAIKIKKMSLESSEESQKKETSIVEPCTLDPSAVETSIEIQSHPMLISEGNLYSKEINEEKTNKTESNVIKPINSDIINIKIDVTKVESIAMETNDTENEKESNILESIVSEKTEVLAGDFSLANIPSVEETIPKSSSINSTLEEHKTELQYLQQFNKEEPSQTERNTDISSSINNTIQEFSSNVKESSSIFTTKPENTEEQTLFLSEIKTKVDENKLVSHIENKLNVNTLNEKCPSPHPIGASPNKVPKASKSSKSRNIENITKISKEKESIFRSLTTRGCKGETFEGDELHVPTKATNTFVKKLEFINEKSANEKTISSSIKGSTDLSICITNELSAEEQKDNLKNVTNSAVEETFAQPPVEKLSQLEKTANVKQWDSITSVAEAYKEQHIESELNSQSNITSSAKSNESKSHSPVYQEREDVNVVLESKELKPRSSFNEASLACFDFNEEEDILTSIANFKKTYVSPEKSFGFGMGSCTKTTDAQKCELEMKDKQLSTDIESLLKTNLTSTMTCVSSRPLSNEVRGLPIKERGKRIFKSRNRFRAESCPFVSTTSLTKVKSVSSSDLTSNKIDISDELSKSNTQTSDVKEQEAANENILSSHCKENDESAKKVEDKTMDDKVTNSEEEIIGRIMFSPTEVAATSSKVDFIESVQARENLVSSSGMEISSDSLVKYEAVDKCSNKIICDINTETDKFENPTSISNNEEQSEFDCKALTSNISKICDEQNDAKEQCALGNDISKHDQNERNTSRDDVGKVYEQKDKSNTFELPSNVEENPRNELAEISNEHSITTLQDQETNLREDFGKAYNDESIGYVFDKDMPVDEEVTKPNDSNCELLFEYELVTTEVSTIVDNSSNEEQIVENIKESSTEVSEEVVSCCDDGTFLNEMIIAEVTESQSSVTENETSDLTFKFVETETNLAESNETYSYSVIENNKEMLLKSQENNLHDSNVEDRNLQAKVKPTDDCSNDSSSIISEAEAEFGSPTSMLEEERVLNRTISGIETTAVSAEGKTLRSIKKSSRKKRSLEENKHSMESLKCDIQESASNDIINETVYNENKDDVKEYPLQSKPFCSKTNVCSNKLLQKDFIGKATNAQVNNELLETQEEKVIENEKEIDDCFYNSDSSSSEEEICSPPIEPLIDEDTEAEVIERYSYTKSLPKIENETDKNTCDIKTQFQVDTSVKSEESSQKHKSETTNTTKFESSKDLNREQPFSQCTITKKSDDKHEENTMQEVDEGWTETSVDVRKSELAGEELSAAEALLLIPNHTNNTLTNSKNLIKKPLDPMEYSAEVNNTPSLFSADEIKEECSEVTSNQDIELDNKEDIAKELAPRKRRSHLKVTPRKRIIDETKQEENFEDSYTEAKITKLSNSTPEDYDSIADSSKNSELQNKSSAEVYEESFVLKYMKEQLSEEVDLEKTEKNYIEDSDKSLIQTEKQTLEKVHITVDISNPLSSQIATILGTNRTPSTEIPARSVVKKRKQSMEDDIPSFIIKRPCPKTIAEEEAADRETIAQIQNLCPQVEITRKSSKDDQMATTPTSQQTPFKPQIINQQILRPGNNQPSITVTPKCNKTEESIFDISNMPIVLSNEKIINEKVHLVITPTTNPQIIKQFQNQHQGQMSNIRTSTSNYTGNSTTNVSKPGIPLRRSSCVRTKRTPSRQQMPEQQISDIQICQQDDLQQSIDIQQQQQSGFVHSHQQQQNDQQIQQEHNQLQQQRRSQQGQLQQQNQFQKQMQEQQFQHHQQNQMQQQLREEQNILLQQQHQLLVQQQLQQVHNQHQLVAAEKTSQSNISEKQIGVDNRGNKYVIIRNPSNTVLMEHSPETRKAPQRLSTITETCDQSSQRRNKQKKQSPLTVQIGTPSKSPLPVILPTMPLASSPSHILSITSQTNQTQQFVKDQHSNSLSKTAMPSAVTTKPKGRGRGRPPKNKTETVSSTKHSTVNSEKVNANGRRSTGRICEPLRQRTNRPIAATTPSEILQPVISSPTAFSSSQHQTQSVGFIINPQMNSMPVCASPSIHTNIEPYEAQASTLSPESRPSIASEISINTSEVSGGGYAVPSLPVPGYPQTYLLCELIGNKYKEVFSKPLYLSPDRTRFLEVPDELVTEAHTKLSDSRREPNPNALKLVSDGAPHILQSRLIEIDSGNMASQNDGNIQQNDRILQKHQQFSAEEQASALLCLQEQLTQEHLLQKPISQDQLTQEGLVQGQLVQEQIVQEQFVEEQFVQEQFVQEQFVQEQFVQEQFVQEQFVPEQFVQEQFVHEQFVPEQFVQEQFNLQPQQFSLQLARFETGEVIEDAERGQMMVVTAGAHNMILDDKSFFEFTGEKKIDFYNAEKDMYVLTPQVISSLLHHYALGHITAVPALNTEISDQQEVSIADVIRNADSSTNILEVALDESGLYSEEQFINSGQILQIETPEGMQLIGTAGENADLIFHHMAKANTNETNVLLNQAPKMSAVEIPSDKNKRRFDTKQSTRTTVEDCLNVIGVPIQSPHVPTSLELPASVTNPAIVSKTRTPTPGTITMNEIIATGLCHHPDITSLPSMSSNDQELNYEFFQSNTENENKDHVNKESVVTDMGEFTVVTSSASFDDPGR